eukprot:766622-Hanusia_phi.AAC.3
MAVATDNNYLGEISSSLATKEVIMSCKTSNETDKKDRISARRTLLQPPSNEEVKEQERSEPRSITDSDTGFHTKGFHKNFELGKTLGKGTFAKVKLARHKKTGSCFAVKIIDKQSATFKRESLKSEILLMRQVVHPNCVRLHGVYDEKLKCFLVLDLASGGTVLDRIIENDRFKEEDAKKVSMDVLNAIGYLHSLGISHRDLKPENLLYASNDPQSPDYTTVKVADFGLSKIFFEKQAMRTVCGSPNYVAPEVVDPYCISIGYGPEVDIWSMGIVIYVMLCGFLPFYADSNAELFKLICAGDFSFPSPYWDGISDSAKHLIKKMLVVNPKRRLSPSQCLEHQWFTQEEKSLKEHALHSHHRAFLLIRKLPVFDSIDPKVLLDVTRRLKIVKVGPGQPVINAGDEGDSMYFIHYGAVKVMVNNEEIDRLVAGGPPPPPPLSSSSSSSSSPLSSSSPPPRHSSPPCLHTSLPSSSCCELTYPPGDFFGEVALTVAEQRTADIVSLGYHDVFHHGISPPVPAEFFRLMRSDFKEVIDKNPTLQQRLAQVGQVRKRSLSMHKGVCVCVGGRECVCVCEGGSVCVCEGGSVCVREGGSGWMDGWMEG